MHVTIKKLAAELGLSPGTVSLALNNDPRIAVATKARVKQLAAKLSYVPNNFGRGLQAGKSCLAGYMANSVIGSFFNIILQGIGEAATAADYGLLTVLTGRTALDAQIRLFLGKNIDGLITSINYSGISSNLKMLESRQIPVVFCSVRDSGPHPYVITDDFAGGQLAAEHLVSLGHRCLACCNEDTFRLKGNLDVIGKAKLPPPIIFRESEELEDALKGRRISGIIAYSDQQAIKLKHMAERYGLRIPADLSIVGFDDLWFAELEEFNFTTVAQPKIEIGRQAMELLLQLIKTGKGGNRLLKPELVVRKSTASPAPVK
ncbi:MAG: LacI family DNA-binding transcriptional regulator [Victivallaceae bacterium]|nr:LacI family DNA-binding transcriptional regulator [Victivallaceae bacterium]